MASGVCEGDAPRLDDRLISMSENDEFIVRHEYPRGSGAAVRQLRQDLSLPAVCERKLKKGDHIRLLVVEKKMARRFMEQARIAVALSQAIVKVPIL